ncbi:unnamed protein product [Prunus brigantina]
MIIRAEIADYDVGRVLIDNGSSVNVIFADAFRGMGIADSQVNRQITPLLSFSGDLVQPVGSVSLPIAFGVAPQKTMIYDQIKAHLSPHMLLMKFPTCNGTGVVRGDQLRARTCNATALKSVACKPLIEAMSVQGLPNEVISHKLSISHAHKHVRQKRRSYDAERYEAMCTEVDKLKAIGFIREATYPDSFPLPRIDQLVDATAGHELLSFMDAYSRYNQIFMHPAGSEHTAFITDRGLYCYNVIPFGFKNAGATYQRLVNRIFAKHIGSIMEVYVDDMLVKSRTAEEHLENLALMFGILKDYRMRLNPTKCAFALKWGKQHIAWTAECDKAFQDLRNYMSKAPLLSKPLPGEVLLLYLSISSTAVSSVRLIKWAIELGEFDIQFKPRPAEKGQAVVDFISELTPSVPLEPTSSNTDAGEPERPPERFDPSIPVEYALRFNFRTSNNEAEYEALLAGLRLARA